MARVVLAMSGGVDSSVAAHLLQRQGHQVIGVFMRHGILADTECRSGESQSTVNPLPILSNHRPSQGEQRQASHKQGCCTASDAADARRVAELLGIDFYAINLDKDFARIVDYFVDEYNAARTPNPCVMCNNWIKFGRLFDYAESIDATFVATGHYAQLDATADEPALYRGQDASKDQSYVLFGIDRSHLQRMMLPVGSFDKPSIRQLAAELNLDVASKRDSQEICFVAPGQHSEFVASRSPQITTNGNIVTTEGEIVGAHDGYQKFTIGQRRGLGTALGEPRFVTRIDPITRDVVIGRRAELARKSLVATQANWLIDPPQRATRCCAQIRYNSSAQSATLYPTDEQVFEVVFDDDCYAVAPGQAVVCYVDNRVLGGGWIESTA